MKEGENDRPLGESCVLAAVDSHKKQGLCLKSLLLGLQQQHQQDTQTHLGYYINSVFFFDDNYRVYLTCLDFSVTDCCCVLREAVTILLTC